MFEKGEYVVYGTSGVCKVADITTLDMMNAVADRLYYILEPLSVKESRLFTPVDSNKMLMRKIMDRTEAEALIEEVLFILPFTCQDEKHREEQYKTALKSGCCREWIRIIKTIYQRKQLRVQEGKKLTAIDEKYLKQAEEYLYSEMSIPLCVDKNRMEAFITERVRPETA